MQARLLTLPKRQQILLGVGAVILLVVPFVMTQSLIPIGIILAAIIGYAVIRNPVWSIFAFVVINVVLAIRPKQELEGNAPSILDLLLGMVLVGISVYWIIRLRIFEREKLSQSIGQLCIALFMVWSVFVTIIGFIFNDWSINNAIRELLNLSPLLVLPILYSREIEPDSKNELRIFFTIIISAVIVIIWNIIFVKRSIATAVYLYETDRGAFDIGISCFLILFMTSILMMKQRWWQSLLSIFLLLFGFVGLVVSFTRTLYILIFLSMAIVLFLGTKQERKQGALRLLLTLVIAIIIAVPIIYSNRTIRLLLIHFGLRFLTTGHFGTDLSLLNRFSEAANIWKATMLSPILGNGFGARFRTFNIIGYFHQWSGFSHNSYLYIAFKTGIVGALLLCIAIFHYFLKWFRLERTYSDTPRSRIALRACVAFLVLVFLGAFIGPTFDSKTDLVWVGLVWGYFLAVDRNASVEPTIKSSR